jgi:hypothetical protein
MKFRLGDLLGEPVAEKSIVWKTTCIVVNCNNPPEIEFNSKSNPQNEGWQVCSPHWLMYESTGSFIVVGRKVYHE